LIYVILVVLFAGILCIDYIPRRQVMTRPLRLWYLSVCLFCFAVLMLDQVGVPFPRIGTVLIWMIQKIFGV